MFFELIGFEDRDPLELWERLKRKTDYFSIYFYKNIIKIKKISVSQQEFGFLIRYKYNNNDLFRKIFSMIIHKDLNFFLLETENNASFRTQILEILNENFKNDYYFFPKILTIEEGWNLLKIFNRYSNLKLFTNEGLVELEEDIMDKEKFPIYSSIIEANINERVYTIQFFNNGFNFPPRMNESEISGFLNQTKDILT